MRHLQADPAPPPGCIAAATGLQRTTCPPSCTASNARVSSNATPAPATAADDRPRGPARKTNRAMREAAEMIRAILRDAQHSAG